MLKLLEKNLQFDYDEDADILYLSFGPPMPCASIERDVVIRIDPTTGSLAGITIIGLKRTINENMPR